MITIKTKDEIEKIRAAGAISAELFDYIKQYVQEGITTLELDKIAEDFIIKHGAKPSFKNYEGFPGSICASLNEEIIHGIPSKRKLKNGDIFTIDVGVQLHGFISDSARTYPVGKISDAHKKLMERTEAMLYKAIMQVAPNKQINDVGGVIEDMARKYGYGIVYDYCGHGVGYKNHEDPQISNFRCKDGRKKLRAGMVIAIEPMINMGKDGDITLDDGWTVVTPDYKYACHFENTVAVTEDGFDILTIHPGTQDELIEKFSKYK